MSLRLQCLDHCFLLLWCHTSEHAVLCHRILQCFLSCQRRRIYITVRILKSCTSRNRRNCHRVITGNHFKIYFLTVKESQRIRCFFTNYIGKKHQSQRFQSFRKFCPFRILRTVCKYKHSQSFFCISLTFLRQFFIILRKQKLRCSHQISAFFFKNSTTVFTVRRKWNHMFQRHALPCRKALTKCIYRRILIFEHIHHVSHDGIDVISESRICCNLSLRFCLRAF